MLAALLLAQAARFLDPAAPLPEATDPAYAARLAEVLRSGATPTAGWRALQPPSPAAEADLLRLARLGDARALRLAAWLGAGRPADAPLSRELIRAACESRDEAGALGALLAPVAVHPADLPAVAALATSRNRDLALRAAAAGRLLREGCSGAWPVARSVLRTGTGIDEDAPWADWRRTGRYELAKRLLLRDVRGWLESLGLEAPVYEPNAAWERQAEQLAMLEAVVQQALGIGSSRARSEAFDRSVARLLQAAARGDAHALRALPLLRPRSTPVLLSAAGRGDPALEQAARTALSRTPG